MLAATETAGGEQKPDESVCEDDGGEDDAKDEEDMEGCRDV